MPELHGSSVPLLQQILKSIKTHELAKTATKKTIPSKRSEDVAQDNISKYTLTSTVLNLPKLKNQACVHHEDHLSSYTYYASLDIELEMTSQTDNKLI